jgi:hypothetical protein
VPFLYFYYVGRFNMLARCSVVSREIAQLLNEGVQVANSVGYRDAFSVF